MDSYAFTKVMQIWPKYFPNDRPPIFNAKQKDARISIIETFLTIFIKEENTKLLGYQNWSPESLVYFDVQELASICPIPDFNKLLRTKPRELSGCIGIAMTILASHLIPAASSSTCLPWLIRPRFTNLGEETPFELLKSSCVGQFVCFRGHVVRVSPPRPLVIGGWFSCSKCGDDTWQAFEDGVYCVPVGCKSTGCRSKTLELRRDRVDTEEYQTVRIQELDRGGDTAARVPRTQDVEVRGWESINRCVAGDLVVVVGQVQTAQKESRRGYGKQQRESGIHTLYVLASSITCSRNSGRASSGSEIKSDSSALGSDTTQPITGTNNSFSESEISTFKQIANGGMGLLVASFCPPIYGHEKVKLGLLLGLMGGTRQGSGDGRSVSTRPDIHVIVVGDPGLGKSQLLRAAANCAPRVVSICGNTATTAGLTVAVTREGKNDMVLEAGALVLADRGICCIDELDKMAADSHALLEAMEQQRVSVAKAGAITSVRCRTTVLAAANPCGHYNRHKTVSENLKMNVALLSRFDLVFLIVDKPDARHDRMISEHILRTRAIAEGKPASNMTSNPFTVGSLLQNPSDSKEHSSIELRLASVSAKHTNLVPADVLRRYVEYARTHVRSRMTVNAAKVLQRLYLTMRSQASIGQSIPVTTRHLESLIRLAQARAKMELRTMVTEQDASDVVALLQESLLDAFTNEAGEVDLSRKGGGGTVRQVKALVKQLSTEAARRNNNVFSSLDIEAACSLLRLEKDPASLIETMHTECYLLKKGASLWQLNCV